jgi:glycerol kinase
LNKLVAEDSLCFGTIDTWLLHKMTNGKIHATDYSNIAGTGLWDPFDMTWNTIAMGVTT